MHLFRFLRNKFRNSLKNILATYVHAHTRFKLRLIHTVTSLYAHSLALFSPSISVFALVFAFSISQYLSFRQRFLSFALSIEPSSPYAYLIPPSPLYCANADFDSFRCTFTAAKWISVSMLLFCFLFRFFSRGHRPILHSICILCRQLRYKLCAMFPRRTTLSNPIWMGLFCLFISFACSRC